MIELANMLQTMGGWGTTVICIGAIVTLWRARNATEREHAKALAKASADLTDYVERSLQISKAVEGGLSSAAERMADVASRLEALERAQTQLLAKLEANP